MRHESTPQMTALKNAAATVRHHLTGTPINPAEFEIKTQTLACEKSRIMGVVGMRRAWALNKERFDLVRAFDQLIKICER